MTTRRFTPAALEAIGVPFELDGDDCATEIQDRIVGSTSRTEVHELIFRAPDDGRAYRVRYEVGATEEQDIDPWRRHGAVIIDPWRRHGAVIKAVEVVERHALVTRWAPVTDEAGPGGVLAEIAAERAAQDTRWGEQNHPDGTGDQRWRDAASRVRSDVDDDARQGRTTWNGILREEVFEALAEGDPARLRAELVQVAAVATAWIEAIDRRTAEAGEAK